MLHLCDVYFVIRVGKLIYHTIYLLTKTFTDPKKTRLEIVLKRNCIKIKIRHMLKKAVPQKFAL